MTSSSASNLLTQAHAEGLLSSAGLQSLTSFDFGASIQAGLGLSVDDVFAADAVLVSLLIDDSGSIAAAIAGGARGYLRWDASRPELVAALAHTLASTSVPAPRTPSDSGVQLTERELQVLRGMAQGKSNGQIGRELYLSEDTVKTHARRLFRKLGVNDRAQAVALGFRRGFVH